MRRPWRILLAGLVLLAAGDARPQDEGDDLFDPDAGAGAATARRPGPAPAADKDAWLAAALEQALAAHPELAAARVGVAVAELESGRLVWQRAGDEPKNVASVAKLVTTGAALALLGPEYRYETTLLADRWHNDTVGDLYLRGRGDPSLSQEDLAALVSELRLVGIRRVRGSLCIDDGFFDDVRQPPAFGQKNEDAAFRAPVSAASLNYNAVLVRVQPGAGPGAPARAFPDPPSAYVEVVVEATTVAEGRTAIRVAARPDGDRLRLVVTGTIRADSAPLAYKKRIERPDLYLGETLRTMLLAAGVDVAARPILRRAAPAGARAIATHRSAPLGLLVRDLAKRSNNFIAEAVLKTLGAEASGAPGTWEAGLAAVRGWLRRQGIAPGTYRFENGSGLYDSNALSPRQIVAVLRGAARDFQSGPEFLAALSIAGADGTLSHRMRGTAAERRVRGKTGTLAGASALAGVVGDDGRPALAFAVLVNEIPARAGAARAARALEDEIAELLALYVSAP